MDNEIFIDKNSLDKLNSLHGNGKYVIKYICVICGKEVKRNYYPGKKSSYIKLRCEKCVKTKVDHGIGYSKNNPFIITEYNNNIFQEFMNKKRNRVWIKYNCSKCGKEVITEFTYWDYIRSDKLQQTMSKFQCRECNCKDTKEMIRNHSNITYNNSFEYTDDGYKIINTIDDIKKINNNCEKIVFHCSEPKCIYHYEWFKMNCAKKDRLDKYIKYGKLLCPKHRFEKSYPTKEANINRKNTFINNWGTSHFMKNREFRIKYYNNLMKKYGSRSTLISPDVIKKRNKTMLDRYGTIYPLQNKNLLDKSRKNAIKTMYDKYGTLHVGYKYNYYGIYFDSSWELAVWIYCIDNNISIIRNPCTFNYTDSKGNIRSYIPDFMINGQLVEVKGDHYFKPDGTMVFPYNKLHHNSKEFTLEEKEFMDDLYERKHQCGLSNNVLFLTNKDILPYINYCNNKYPNWNILFRKDNIFNPSYYIYTIPLYNNNGITPYDIKKNDKYIDIKSKGITPFDIEK